MKNKEKWTLDRWIWNEKRQSYQPNLKVIYPGSVHIASLQVSSYYPMIRAHMHGVLLDCGCDVVPYYGMYKDLCDDIVCLDWATTRRDNQYADIFSDLNEPLPFPDHSFDSILLTDVLMYIKDPKMLFAEFSRILRPGGKLLVTAVFNSWFSEPPYDFGRYSKWMMEDWCRQVGLDVKVLEAYGGHADVLLDVVNKGMTGRTANRIFRMLRAVVIKTGWYRKNNERTKGRYPIGYILVAEKPILGGHS